MATSTGRKKVKFEFRDEAGKKVFVAGDFNDWSPTNKPLKYDSKREMYVANLLLPAGRYEYKFVVDDAWCIDPECGDWAPNDHGSLNSIKIV